MPLPRSLLPLEPTSPYHCRDRDTRQNSANEPALGEGSSDTVSVAETRSSHEEACSCSELHTETHDEPADAHMPEGSERRSAQQPKGEDDMLVVGISVPIVDARASPAPPVLKGTTTDDLCAAHTLAELQEACRARGLLCRKKESKLRLAARLCS